MPRTQEEGNQNDHNGITQTQSDQKLTEYKAKMLKTDKIMQD
jgi:hypothetical protein